MAININQFTSKFDGGARSNLFKIQITGTPVAALSADEQLVYVKAIQLPEHSLGEIPVNHMGRTYKIPGDRVYNDVQLTILSDGTNMAIRHKFEAWNHAYNRHQDNTGIIPGGQGLSARVLLTQLDRNHNAIRTYTLERAWCADVSSVDMSYDNQDALVEFTVTIKYHFFTVSGSGGSLS
jgi:hypothetical protein